MKTDDMARLERKKSKHSAFPPHWLFPRVAPGIVCSDVQVLFKISLKNKQNFYTFLLTTCLERHLFLPFVRVIQ